MAVSSRARIHRTAVIAPSAVVEDDVQIGAGTIIDRLAVIRNGTRIGRHNRIGSGAQIGIEPQDYHYRGESSWCVIGDRNIIREYATISRATGSGRQTVVGDDNFIMTYVHIAHNCIIGRRTVIASAAQIGGYVEIDDYAVVGGLSGIHQYCRIGFCAMLGAKSYLNKDLGPYLLACGNRARVYGINVRGLRKHGFGWRRIHCIKELYESIRTQPFNKPLIRAELRRKHQEPYLREVFKFIKTSRRGILMPAAPGCKKLTLS